MKVVGCKVNDKIYQKFKNLNRPISQSLREAINNYFNQIEDLNKTVNHIESPVNHSNQSESVKTITNSLKYLQDLYDKSNKEKNHSLNLPYSSKQNEINKIINKKISNNKVNHCVNQAFIQHNNYSKFNTSLLKQTNLSNLKMHRSNIFKRKKQLD
jgi:predicted DNA-binding protein